MKIKMIAAVSKNGIIGVEEDGKPKIPWHYKEDMAFFKKMTTDCIIVMGRKTFESIGRPLPKRRNIVVSSNLQRNDVEVVNSLEGAFELCKDDARDIWLCGGFSIYEAGLQYADEVHLTLVPQIIHGDNLTRFPWMSPEIFNLVEYTSLENSELKIAKYKRENRSYMKG